MFRTFRSPCVVTCFAILSLQAMYARAASIPTFASASAPDDGRILTVVINLKTDRYSDVALAAMKKEATRLFRSTDLQIDWKYLSSLPAHPQFDDVVVFTLRGSCNVNDDAMPFDERGPLGFTHVSDGQVLPFAEIACDHVLSSFRSTARNMFPRSNQLFGIALGRVVAHEMYHMLSGQQVHSQSGLACAKLPPEQLIFGALNLDKLALRRIGAYTH